LFGEKFTPFNFDDNPLDKSDGSSLMSKSELEESEEGSDNDSD